MAAPEGLKIHTCLIVEIGIGTHTQANPRVNKYQILTRNHRFDVCARLPEILYFPSYHSIGHESHVMDSAKVILCSTNLRLPNPYIS